MKYFFETYGCQMNIAESAAVEQLFLARGWEKSESAQVADIVIINTCSVRETAENRIFGRLGWFAGLKAVRACEPGAKHKSLEEAVRISADFTCQAIYNTIESPAHWYGVKFETQLPWLMEELFA